MSPAKIAKILRIIALVLAVAAAVIPGIPYVAIAFIVLGLAIGYIGVEEDGRVAYFVLAIALASVVGALGPIPEVGPYLTAILTNISSVVNAGAVAIVTTIIYERVTE